MDDDSRTRRSGSRLSNLFLLVFVKASSPFFYVKNLKRFIQKVMVVINVFVLTTRISKLSRGSFILFKTEIEVIMAAEKINEGCLEA